MKLSGAMPMFGFGKIKHYRNGKLIDEITFFNTITNAGKAEAAGLFNEARAGGFKYVAIGSSGTVAAAANTALAGEITGAGMARVEATCSRTTTTVTDDTAELLHTFTATASQEVREVGIFDTATSGGTMAGRSTFAVKNMETDDVLQVLYKVKMG